LYPNTKDMKKLSLASFLLLLCCVVRAVVADPTPFYYHTPDGQDILVQMQGDEYHHYMTDMQGNVIMGHRPDAAELQQIGMRRMANQQMIGGNFPLIGSPKSVVILINFSDVKFQYSWANFDHLLNQSGYSDNGATGSCRDYFIACSDSIFTPQFDVYGPYTVSHTQEYYGKNTSGQHSDKEKEAFIEACQLAAEDGVDFTQYDTDGDNVIDNVFFYYAGNNEAEGNPNTIWPHSSNLSYKNIYLSGKLLATYACTSELKGRGNTMCAIGTFCHEFGHVLGLPDWYDTDKGKYTIGEWSIMSSGNYNNNSCTPPSYNAYERFYLGWLRPQQLSRGNTYYLSPLTESNQAYLIAETEHNLNSRQPNPSEFFLLENRQQVGWDAPYLPGEGMLVWHVDFSASAWSANNPNNFTPMRMHLEEADGRHGTSSATDPYPGIKGITAFTPVLHDGTTLSDQPVFGIAENGTLISFIYKNAGETKLTIMPDKVDFEVNVDDQNQLVNWTYQTINLQGHDLDSSEVFVVKTPDKSDFVLTVNRDALQNPRSQYWSHKITLHDTISEGQLNATFYLSYRPLKQSCETETGILTVQSDSNMISLSMTGRSPRPSYICTPQPQAETGHTPFAFTTEWPAVPDAELYYMTVYQSEQGTTEYVQDFEHFSSSESVAQQGWQTTTYKTTTLSKQDGKYSLLMQNTGDKIISETYPAPVSRISFWVNSMANSTGELILEATADGSIWRQVNTTLVETTTCKKIFSYDISLDSAYTCFSLSYHKSSGTEGIALDAFTATCNERITYLYKGTDLAIDAYTSDTLFRYTLSGLSPANRYFYRVQCTDGGKGCQEIVTELSKSREVHTLSALPTDTAIALGADSTLMGIDYYTYLKSPMVGYTLYFYTTIGQLVYEYPVSNGESTILLPQDRFVHGQVYIIKYAKTNHLERKAIWKKFIYRQPSLHINK